MCRDGNIRTGCWSFCSLASLAAVLLITKLRTINSPWSSMRKDYNNLHHLSVREGGVFILTNGYSGKAANEHRDIQNERSYLVLNLLIYLLTDMCKRDGKFVVKISSQICPDFIAYVNHFNTRAMQLFSIQCRDVWRSLGDSFRDPGLFIGPFDAGFMWGWWNLSVLSKKRKSFKVLYICSLDIPHKQD